MKHPANCQLLRHKDNQSKNKKSQITLKQLIVKVEEFEEKYKYSIDTLEYIKVLKNKMTL